ncbi:3-isopropylmalate dehydratase [Rhodococcus sp. SRB_17]|uniref:3-isopropylmalate dehydratase large subunit n=1 Tax=Acidovorax sp. SRB_24 TaxID=1962700 RepID=UPI00145FA2B1|nr:3-isopropylmalate dehydratase large subunit [Acidovorax sp. SRB_24]NMM76916.1 3-isopropylmalate dehydratase [Acidovorax sp. SRB_24]NMM87366.1 3-isopropylmalate dehydratase [Rhodococcus sp. SRB_17]
MTHPRTSFEKIWSSHVIAMLDDCTALLQIDRLFLHDGSIAMRTLAASGRQPDSVTQVATVIDHTISTRPGRGPNDTRSGEGAPLIQSTRDLSRRYGVTFFDVDDPRQGIVHVVAPERGIALPGLTLVCGDSHTCTVGGVGALAWGIGATESEHVLATQTLAQTKPKTMRVSFEGSLAPGVGPKDMILALIGQIGANGGIGYAVEFAGRVVRSMAIEGRLTLCNMAIEFSAKYGFVPADEVTLAYLKGREFAPQGEAWERAAAYWRGLATDCSAVFDHEVTVDCTGLKPHVTWGTSPMHVVPIDGRVPDPSEQNEEGVRAQMSRALDYMQLSPGAALEGLLIQGAYIGSCTNARLSDLREAAAVLRGRKVASGVTAICVPGSTEVKKGAEAEGLDQVFLDAGFQWHEAGCGMCGNGGGGEFADKRVISTTNRNFEGRQGTRTRTHLASPAMVAASAVKGSITDPRSI